MKNHLLRSGGVLAVMLFGLCFFFYRSSEDHAQAERAAAVAQ